MMSIMTGCSTTCDPLYDGLVQQIVKDADIMNYILKYNVHTSHAHIVFITLNLENAVIVSQKVNGLEYIAKVQAIDIYANIWLTLKALEYIKLPNFLNGKQVWIEHTSMTPCYPINCATARSLVIGERLRRCACIAQAKTSGRFFIEDSAHQIEAVRLPVETSINENLKKADHLIGYHFVKSIKDADTARSIFPKGEYISEESIDQYRTMCFSDVVAVGDAFGITLKAAGVRNIEFDYERDVYEKLTQNRTAKDLLMAISSSNNALKKQEIHYTRYLHRSVIYYIYMLCFSDLAISVVPLNQIDILYKARKIALDLCHKEAVALRLIFYGEVTINNTKDAPKKGIYHTLDDMLATNSPGLFQRFEKEVLQKRPKAPLHFSTDITSDQNNAFIEVKHTNPEENTIQIGLLIEELPSLIDLFLTDGNFCHIMRWKYELSQRLVFGVKSSKIYHLGNLLLTMIG